MKTTTLALASLLLVGSFAAPALAASDTDSSFDSDYILIQLQQKGFAAVDVAENWNGKIRATVVQPDGSQIFMYFHENTLQPVTATGANTRVLSRLDTGAGRAPVLDLASPGTTSIGDVD